jgi:hypothetical protein
MEAKTEAIEWSGTPDLIVGKVRRELQIIKKVEFLESLFITL